MSVTIRLARIGRKNLAAYRIVVSNTRSKRNGVFLDTIGSYNPSEKPVILTIDKEKLKHWTENGALITDAVKKLTEGTYEYKAYPSAKRLKREAAKAANVQAKAEGKEGAAEAKK